MNRNSRYYLFCKTNIYVSILIASLAYVFFYQDRYIQIYEESFPAIKYIREMIYCDILYRSSFGTSIRNHLTDFLWAYSLAWVYILHSNNYKKDLVKCCIICTILECTQLMPPFSKYSTFDLIDIAIQISGVVIANIINIMAWNYFRKGKYEK